MSALAFVLLTASVPPTFRLLPPPTSLNGQVDQAAAGDVARVVGGDRCAAGQPEDPATVLRPVSALLVASVPASAIAHLPVSTRDRHRSCRSGRWRIPAAHRSLD